MADDAGYEHYVSWIEQRDCAVCGASGPCVAHHALYGTTYSPIDATPAKAIPNARKGGAQRSHDYFCIPMHRNKCHIAHFHDGRGRFKGWSAEKKYAWEAEQVAELRAAYELEFPNGDPALVAKTERAAVRKASGSRDPVLKERARVVRVIRARAAERQHLPDQHQLLAELADDIAGGLNDTGAF